MAKTGYGTTWWGRRWLDALTGIDHENRIPRGRAYAEEGKVRSFRIDAEKGEVKARVAGHFDPFYAVKLRIPPIDPRDVERLVDRIADSPLIVARLADRELSPDISELADELGISLFPRSWSDLGMNCSCPDWAVPCKHIAAVIYKMSEEIDANPFLLFTLRGVDLIAEIEARGVSMSKAVEHEMPEWSELIAGFEGEAPATDVGGDGWLEALGKLTFTKVKTDGAAVRALFADHPAGYIHGSLRDLCAGIVRSAGELVRAQMRPAVERTVPEFAEDRPLIAVNTWGQAVADESLFWREKSAGGRFLRQELRDPTPQDPTGRLLHMMFSGFITNRMLAEKPQGLEALYDAWLIAGRLVEAGAVVPQIYAPIEDFFAVRWIPAVMASDVRELTRAVGEAFAEVDRSFFRIAKCPAMMDPLLLGEIVLGMFIQSYIVAAWRRYQAESGDRIPEHWALFGCEPVDCEADPSADALGMRLESWVAPVFTEFHRLEAIVIVHDFLAGRIHRGGLPGEEAPAESASADALADFAREEAAGGRDAGELLQASQEDADYEALSDPERLRAIRGRFPVGIEMRFAEDGAGAQNSVGLIDVLNDASYRRIRFDCLRTVARLSNFCPDLAELLRNRESVSTLTLEELAPLLLDALPTLKLLGVRVILPRSLRTLLKPEACLDLDLDEPWEEGKGFLGLADLIGFNWRLAVGGRTISEKEFEKLAQAAGRVVRFHDAYMYVDPQTVSAIRRQLALKKTLSRAELVRAALSGNFRQSGVRLGRALENALSKLFAEKTFDVPVGLKAELRPYQKRGYAWMMRNLRAGMGSIIADDMGLGKTLQVLTVLEKLRSDGELDGRPALVVVPTTLLTNWQREAARFAPALRISVFYGTGRTLENADGHVILTTYGNLRASARELAGKRFRLIVIDEAQAIKNYKTAGFRAVRSMMGDAFIAMSGTPVENSLMEYWSVMEAANPGLLGTPASFRTDFAQPIENGHDSATAERFRRITSPFILRRLKTDRTIISDLPAKVTTDEYCLLSRVQTALYHAAVERGMKKIEETNDRFERRARVLQLIVALKQICNSPAQYEPAGGYEDPVLSGKMLRLFDILEEMQAAGRKVLIFTQFAQMGMLLQQWIEDRTGRRPQFLHGGLTPARRQEMVDRFQKRRDENVMVLTLKSAGTGLNLTAASAVIHYDLWWNAAVENQATDRAYRIGQTSTVNVYRFICANTFEERINAMIAEKRRLVEMTVAAGENWIGDLSNEELEQVFSLSEMSEGDQPSARSARVKLIES